MVGTQPPQWRLNRWERRGVLAENVIVDGETPWQPIDGHDQVSVTLDGVNLPANGLSVQIYVTNAQQPGIGSGFYKPVAAMSGPDGDSFSGPYYLMKAIVTGLTGTGGTISSISWFARDRSAAT